jgi:DNA polymerase delta subunit 1
VTTTPTGDTFVKPARQKGILPSILEELLAARKRAKNDLKSEKAKGAEADLSLVGVFDARQLSLKVSANSVYGVMGAQQGILPCLEVSSSVTGFGREMIEATKNEVERHYSRANGYEHDAKVVYGDTVRAARPPAPPRAHARRRAGLGHDRPRPRGPRRVRPPRRRGRAARDGEALPAAHQARVPAILESFPDPMLSFQSQVESERKWKPTGDGRYEKTFHPYLLLAKKRYAGTKYEPGSATGKFSCSGLENERRDNPPFVREVVEETLRAILDLSREVPDVSAAVEAVRQLYEGTMSVSKLIRSAGLTKEPKEYKGAPPPHVALALKMAKRDPGSAPPVGSRVSYVLLAGSQKLKVAEKAEVRISMLHFEPRLEERAPFCSNPNLLVVAAHPDSHSFAHFCAVCA